MDGPNLYSSTVNFTIYLSNKLQTTNLSDMRVYTRPTSGNHNPSVNLRSTLYEKAIRRIPPAVTR